MTMTMTAKQQRDLSYATGTFDAAPEEVQQFIIDNVLAHVHYRDVYKYEDGSMGTVRISPNQLRDCLAYMATQQTELEALRELEKVVRADREGCIYVSDIRHPRTGRWAGQQWVRIQDALGRLDKLGRPIRPI